MDYPHVGSVCDRGVSHEPNSPIAPSPVSRSRIPSLSGCSHDDYELHCYLADDSEKSRMLDLLDPGGWDWDWVVFRKRRKICGLTLCDFASAGEQRVPAVASTLQGSTTLITLQQNSVFLKDQYGGDRVAVAGDLVTRGYLGTWSELVLVVWGLPERESNYTDAVSALYAMNRDRPLLIVDVAEVNRWDERYINHAIEV